MTMKIPMIRTAAVAVGLLAALGLAVSAAGPASAPAAKAIVLEYKMPKGRALTYQGKSEQGTVMEVMGQSMDTTTTGSTTYTFTSKGLKDKNFIVGVTIDDMSASVTGAQGDLSPDLSSVKGKSFDMVLSPLGSEVDVTGAEAITYSIATQTQSLASGFRTFFPDMPGKPVKIGDTWPSNSSVTENAGSITVRADIENINTLEGFETVDGVECARISAQVTGTVSGSGNQMGQDVTFTGTIKGKAVHHFAVKEGFYVKSMTETTGEMSIDVPAASMTIPMTQSSKSEVKLTAKK
jgi:hypothetical protein